MSRIRVRSDFQSATGPETVGIMAYMRNPSTCGGSTSTHESGTVSPSQVAPLSSENSARNEWRPGRSGVTSHVSVRSSECTNGTLAHMFSPVEFNVVSRFARTLSVRGSSVAMAKTRRSPWQARVKLCRPVGYERRICPAMGWTRGRAGSSGILRWASGVDISFTISLDFVSTACESSPVRRGASRLFSGMPCVVR